MAVGDLPLLQGLKTSMRWHQSRQKLLAENVANADTPSYRGKDLKTLDFRPSEGLRAPSAPSVAVALTSTLHITGRPVAGEFGAAKEDAFEVTPSGNAVNLEDEMVKSGENQIEYQAITSLYQRSMAMLKTAIGKSG